MDKEVRYRERSQWPPLVEAILGAIILFSGVQLWLTAPSIASGALRLLGLSIVVGGVRNFVAGLTVVLREDDILLHLGRARLIQRSVPYHEIEGLEPVTYSPLREFGGWGIRGIGKKKAWTGKGNQAVRLHLTQGRQLYVGTDQPQRLEERIRSIGGDRLDLT